MDAREPSRARVWLIRLGWGLGGLALVFVLLVVAVRLLAITGAGRGLVERELESRVISGQSIELSGLQGDVLNRMQIGRLVVSDARGAWLEIEGAELDWSPAALLGRTLDIDRLAAREVIVHRRPELLESGPRRAGGGLGGLPIRRLELGALDLPDLALGEALAGMPQRFDVDARAGIGAEHGDARLTLQPLDGEGDRAELVLGWAPGQPLTGHVQASGPEGGLIAQILTLPEGTAPRLDFTARAEADSWQLSARLDASGREIALADAHWQGHQFSGSARVKLDQFEATAPFTARLGRELHLTAEAAGPDELAVLARTERLDATLGLPIDIATMTPTGAPVSIVASTEQARDMLGLRRLRLDRLAFSGHLTETEAGRAIDGELTAAGLGWPRLGSVAEATGPLTLTLPRDGTPASLSAGLQTGGAAAENGVLGELVGPAPRFVLQGSYLPGSRQFRVGRARLEGDALRLDATGHYARDTGELDLEGGLTLDRAPATDLVGGATGQWDLLRRRGEPLALSIDARSGFTGAVPDALQTWLSGPARLSAGLTVAGGTLQAERLVLETDGLRAEGSGAYGDGSLALALSGRLAGGELGPAAFDTLPVEIAAEGPPDALEFAVTARPRALLILGEPIGDPVLAFRGRRTGEAVAGVLDIAAELRGEPLSAGADVGLASGRLLLRNTSLNLAGAKLEGDAAGPLADPAALEGAFTLTTSEIGPAGVPPIRAEARLEAGRLSGAARLDGLRLGAAEFERVRAQFGGDLSAATVELSARGRLMADQTERPLQLASTARLDLMALAGEIDLTGRLGEHEIATTEPLRLARGETGYTANTRLDLFGGEARFDAVLGETGTQLSGAWSGMELAPLVALGGPAGLRGMASGELELFQADDRRTGSFTLAIDELRHAAGPDSRADLDMRVQLDGDRALVDVTADGDAQLNLVATASLPLRPAAEAPLPELDPQAPFSASARGGGDAAALWAFAGPVDTRLEGRFAVDAATTGTLSAPIHSGGASFSDGLFEDGRLGLMLRDIDFEARLSPAAMDITRFEASGAGGGRVRASGAYAFTGAGEIGLTLDRLDPFQRSDVSAALSGRLDLRRRPDGAVIEGNLDIARGRIDVSALPTGGYVTMDVRFDDAAEVAAPPTEETFPIVLDVDLRADRRILVTGSGIDTEWGADLELRGTLRDPRLVGEASIIRGSMDLVGRRLTFAESRVRFDGDPRRARLDLRAERQTDGILAAVLIGGQVDAPEITLTAEPALPEDEVLSQLLFGRAPASLGAVEAAQLGAAAIQLSGGGGFDVTGGLEQSLGVDRLALDFGEDGNATVGAGTYIAEDVYLELRSSTRGAPGIDLEWAPRRNIQIGTEIETEAPPRFTVTWRRDYGRPEPADEPEADADAAPGE